MSSRALKINLADHCVEVTIDPKYHVLQEVMSGYFGLQEGLNTFLKELCHPYRNWHFIINETRTYSLSYFYDLKTHLKGPEAARLYMEISLEAIENAKEPEVRSDAFKNLYLLCQKIIKETGSELSRFLPVLYFCFNQLNKLPEETFSLVVRSYYQLNNLADSLLKTAPPGTEFNAINTLLIKYFEQTFSYWISEKDPKDWFEREIYQDISTELSHLFEPISHSLIKACQAQLHDIFLKKQEDPAETLKSLLELPGYRDFVEHYSSIPQRLNEVEADERLRNHYKLIFISHTMNISGLSIIHEESLREINRIISWLISNEEIQNIQKLIQKTFSILKISFNKFPETVLMCVLNMGRGVYKTDDSDLVNFFNQSVVELGFQTPDFRGMTDEWQIQSNVSHIQNIRTWMEIIKLNPKWSQKLLSSLIIHLSIYGILIKDTDLFPRDITGFLNSDIQPVYNLVKQLMRLFPAYFNEIGAEGQLRDISTRIDELYQRKDILIYFLRKQSHVESSNKIISLIEATLDFWRTKSKEWLKPYLPENIYEQIDEEGPYINGVNKVLNYIFENRRLKRVKDLLTVSDEYAMEVAGEFPEEYKLDIERVALCILFYKLLNQKYCINFCEIDSYITQVRSSVPIRIDDLKKTLAEPDSSNKLSSLLAYLIQLKSIILSPESFKVHEDIYRKRHIAAGIPSMYGSYHETKFDVLGLTFRLEAIVNNLFEKLTDDFDLSFINHETFNQIYEYLVLFKQALKIEGISSKEFGRHLDLLEKSLRIKLVTFTQYLDIFRGFTHILGNIVSDYFNNIHKENLREIAGHISKDKLLPKYLHRSVNEEELFHKVSEIFLRDNIALSLGLQRLDLFLTRILNTLYKQAEKLPLERHYLLLTYNPRKIIASLNQIDSRFMDIVQLGNKALNMIKMKNLGLPVPPGFIITTEVFRCRELIDKYSPANRNFREKVDREISNLEKMTGRSLGNPENPLLVSVRSGGIISLPGMMDSYLNVGMNESIVQGIIEQTGDEWFACDCYRRFLQSYGMSFGLKRDDFDAIINNFKNKYSVPLKRDFTPKQMREVAMAYKELLKSNGIKVEESPREQLYIAIQRVLNSWNSEKAWTYRKIIGISDDWGTSVTVQAMVFGNISSEAGSGVLFTHSPKFSTDLLRPWGDYTIGNQGEDVVSGLVATYPISNHQAKMENRPVEYSLEKKFPEIYQGLKDMAKLLIYEKQWSPQDIEFTFEGPRKDQLYILQTRDMEMRERKRFQSFVSSSEMSERLLGHGIGVSGGAMTGRVVFTLEDISFWRKTEPETSLILVRGDTVPDDITEISQADGLLTARGGSTSHAAIVANRLEKTCVVGCTDLICMEKEKNFILNQKVIKVGEFISIDGSEGSIYHGVIKISEREIA